MSCPPLSSPSTVTYRLLLIILTLPSLTHTLSFSLPLPLSPSTNTQSLRVATPTHCVPDPLWHRDVTGCRRSGRRCAITAPSHTSPCHVLPTTTTHQHTTPQHQRSHHSLVGSLLSCSRDVVTVTCRAAFPPIVNTARRGPSPRRWAAAAARRGSSRPPAPSFRGRAGRAGHCMHARDASPV